jgi:hypothetical protein
MPFDDMQAQHHIWDAHPNHHPELVWKDRFWFGVIFLAATFACLGYVFWLVIQKESQQQKQK